MLGGNFLARFAKRATAVAIAVLIAFIGRAAAQTPSVPTNTALQAASTAAYPNGVWRLDFAVNNGAPPVYYFPQTTGPCSNPDNGAQVNSADGNCWKAHFSSSSFDVRDWGALGDFNGTSGTDNAAAINSAITYALSLSTNASGPGYPKVVLGGGHAAYGSGPVHAKGFVYGVGSPINISGKGLVFGDGTGALVALAPAQAQQPSNCSAFYAGTSPPPGPPPDPWDSNTDSPPCGMVNIAAGAGDITISIARVDGNSQSGVAGITNSSTDKIYLHGDILNFGSYGIWNSGGLRDDFCHITQSAQLSGRTGYDVYNAAAHDTRFVDCTLDYAMVPIYIDSASADFQFRSGHIMNGATQAQGGTGTYQPVDAILNSGGSITSSTIDTGSIEINVKSGNTSPPRTIIADNFFKYNADAAQGLAAWIILQTQNSATGTNTDFTSQRLAIADNSFTQRPTVVNLQLSVKSGSVGSWNNPAYQAQALINDPTMSYAHPGYVGGTWYLPGQQEPVAAIPINPGANQIVCSPGLVSSAVTVKGLGAKIVTAAPGDIQLAVYSTSGAATPFGAPQTLLLATTTFGTDATGTFSDIFPSGSQLSPGIYWFCENMDNSGAALESFDTVSPMPAAAMIGSSDLAGALGATKNAGLTTPQTFGTWPLSFGPSQNWSYTSAANAPVVIFKVTSSP